MNCQKDPKIAIIHTSSKQQYVICQKSHYVLAAIHLWVWHQCRLNVQLDHKCSRCILSGCLYPGCGLFHSTGSLIFQFRFYRNSWTHERCMCWAFSVQRCHQGKLQMFGIPGFSLLWKHQKSKIIISHKWGRIIDISFFSVKTSESPICCMPHLPPLTQMFDYHAVMQTYAHATIYRPNQSRYQQSQVRESPPFSHAYTFLWLFIHLLLTRILNAIFISRSNPPSLNEKAITIGFSPVPVAWRRCPKTCLPTCLQLCVCFSLRFPSLPMYLFSLSPWLQTLSLFSILSAATLFRSSHLWALSCCGF